MTDPRGKFDRLYRDRNLLAVAFAVWLHDAGYDAGYYLDDSPWPVVWIQLPAATPPRPTCGYHVPPCHAAMLEASPLPNAPYEYDGHTRAERNNRLLSFISEVEMLP